MYVISYLTKKGKQSRHIIRKNNHTFSPLWQRNLPHKINRPLRSWEDVHSYVLGLLWVSQSLPVKCSVCFTGQSALWRGCVLVFVISYMPTSLESFDINCPIAIQEMHQQPWPAFERKFVWNIHDSDIEVVMNLYIFRHPHSLVYRK